MSIDDKLEKIKLFVRSDTGRDIYLVLVIILVGTASFGLGRLSKTTPEAQNEVKIVQTGDSGSQVSNQLYKQDSQPSPESPGTIFASKNGTKYYLPGCSSRVKEENKIFFKTEEEAQAFGYTRSATCK